jgi:hypothetical protein
MSIQSTAPTSEPIESIKDKVIIDLPGADVTLLSSDGARFNVVKAVLAVASPFFYDMFKLPQLHDNTPTKPHKEEDIPMVTESTVILEALLRYALPIAPRHTLTDINQAVNLLDSARKFQMEGPELSILSDVVTLLASETNPLRAWSYAIRCNSHVARKAAMMRYLMVDDSDMIRVTEDAIGALEFPTARSYHELVKWRENAVGEARKIATQVELQECSVTGGVRPITPFKSDLMPAKSVNPTSFTRTFTATMALVNPFSHCQTEFHAIIKACTIAARSSPCSCVVCRSDPWVSQKAGLEAMTASLKNLLNVVQSGCFAMEMTSRPLRISYLTSLSLLQDGFHTSLTLR